MKSTTGYIISYSELRMTFSSESKQNERKEAFCNNKKLIELLKTGKVTVWNARFVNRELDDVSRYKVLE